MFLFSFDYDRWLGWLGPTGAVLAAIVLILVCVIAWGANLMTLPGNWISVAAMAIYAWLGPSEGRLSIGMTPLICAFLFALFGEIIEFVAGAAGAKRAGASRRSTFFAVLGSMAGALTGALVGLPVPVVGPVLAAILFGGVGATAGAVYGEWTDGRSWKESWNVGHAAFWGRTFGTLGKFLAGLAVVLSALVGVIW
ncbi:hypothetical protein CA13_48210 [Planctomycetes bacterium CA13]|uniref:DUF456 domain-containing protein n=2 Tax=Novipirellula herctigrandis TaxID=2527986 RepID=A0A5C5Z8E8_9BACT|nr:hypothetical protein CA13_48210 [Planctomycetes bacterium CA13]